MSPRLGFDHRRFVPHAPWKADAACRGLDTNLFFPGTGEPATEAKRVGRTCPVRAECLEFGLPESFGVFGGLTEIERRSERRRRAQRRRAG